MNIAHPVRDLDPPIHDWLKRTHVAFVPGAMTPLLEEVAAGVLRHFEALGHTVQAMPTDETDILLTSAAFGKALNWRRALMLTARAQFGLEHSPDVFTLVHVRPQQLRQLLAHFEHALAQSPPDPEDYEFPGLAPQAYRVLHEQGRRGGPLLALERLIQAQCKSIRVLLVVGEDRPQCVYHFDLVGAHPASLAEEGEAFYRDIVLRMVTTVSTAEVTDHKVSGEPIPYNTWQQSPTPAAMLRAARALGRRHFFTEMVRIEDLVNVPAVPEAVATQYSEGCFASWDTGLEALIATVTGSARPVDKNHITEDDLAVLVAVRPDGSGAYVREVEGKRNDPPSSEAVEMLAMDRGLPWVPVGGGEGASLRAPVARSKLHGHRGVAAYNPELVEFTPLDPPYFHYIVSCATEAQAVAVEHAFARAQTLQNPQDPRPLAFTILPGHGLVIVEKWLRGKEPFQAIWEAMDAGDLVIASRVPQGPMRYERDDGGMMRLHEDGQLK